MGEQIKYYRRYHGYDYSRGAVLFGEMPATAGAGMGDFSLKTAVGGEVFLTQRRRDAENAEKIEKSVVLSQWPE